MADSSHVRRTADNTADNDEATDLPILHSWPAVYGFVLSAFVVWVVLLTILSRAFL